MISGLVPQSIRARHSNMRVVALCYVSHHIDDDKITTAEPQPPQSALDAMMHSLAAGVHFVEEHK